MILLAAALASLDAKTSASQSADGPVQWAQLSVERRVIMRIPMMSFRRPPDPPHVRWREKKGPRCIALRDVRGARIVPDKGIDMYMRNDSLIRIHLEHGCRTADMYSGFYIRPHDDGVLCSDRDELLARSGMRCEIEAFRHMVPEAK